MAPTNVATIPTTVDVDTPPLLDLLEVLLPVPWFPLSDPPDGSRLKLIYKYHSHF